MKILSMVILAATVCYVIADDQNYVSKQASFKQLIITPSFVPISGNVPITIEGPSIGDASKIEVRFLDTTVKTITANIVDGKVIALVPYLYTNGRIPVEMIITRPNTAGGDVFYGFIYTEKHSNDVKFELVSKNQIKVSWDQTKFVPGATLKLVLLELVGGVFTRRGAIKTDIPNTGEFTGKLDNDGIAIIQKLKNIHIVQLETTTHIGTTQVSSLLNSLATKSQAQIDQLCYDWYIQDSGAPTDAECCPPTEDIAKTDERFELVDDLKFFNPDADVGYRQRVPSKSGAGQRCVYKGGKLLVGAPSGGSVRKVSPNGDKGELAYFVADQMPWMVCCNNDEANCKLFYERRPSNDGSCYKSPATGIVYGDPHFTTFDGFYYTFLGLGEFWIIKSEDNIFSMQGRFTQYLDTGATVCTVYVMRYRGCGGIGTIQLSLMKDYIEIMIDGQIVQFDTTPNQPKRTIVHKGANIAINSQKDISIAFASGYAFRFTYDPTVINMISQLNPKLKGSFRGLFGNFDDNQDNELTYPNGKVIPKNSNDKDIFDFGMSWKITSEDSLFTYPSDRGYESFHDDKYVPNPTKVDVENASPEAKEVCGGNNECLFDYIVTGNLEMAISTMKTVQTYTSITQTFSGSCPRVSVPPNGSVEILNYGEGSIVKLVCNVNFQLNGSDTIKCVQNAEGLMVWEGTLGECTSASICASMTNTWQMWLCEKGIL